MENLAGRGKDCAKERGKRIAAAACFAALAGSLTLWVRLSGHFAFSDFDRSIWGARQVLGGIEPYGVGGLYYPMTAVVVAMPFAPLPLALSAALWTALGFGLLAYGLSARGWWPLLMLASFPALNAMQVAQWTPILTASALIPSLAFIAVAKPTTGFAIAAAYRGQTVNRWAVFGGLALVLIAFAVAPLWVPRWLASVRGAAEYVPLVRRPLGFLLLLALLRWRRPEALLIALLALVPTPMRAYDALPLVLVPESRREIMFALAMTCIAAYGASRIPDSTLAEQAAAGAP